MKGGKGKNLPDEDHVIRYVPWGRLRKDEDDNVLGFLPQAFQLRPEEDYLSVNWVEYHDGDRESQIRLSVWDMRDSFGKATWGKKRLCNWQCRSGQENLSGLRQSRARYSRTGPSQKSGPFCDPSATT
jgi:hypothetical protein